MPADWISAKAKLLPAAAQLFARDARIFSVGLGWLEGQPVLRVARSTRQRTADNWRSDAFVVDDLRVSYREYDSELTFEAEVSRHVGQTTNTQAGHMAMACRPRTLRCGAEVQNFSLDFRAGNLTNSTKTVGTVGCFVRLASGRLALLSNAHVLSVDGQALDRDAVYSGGCYSPKSDNYVAEYVGHARSALRETSSVHAPDEDSQDWNDIDAATAEILGHVSPEQSIQTKSGAVPLSGVQEALPGDHIFLKGSSTGYTEGVVDAVGTIVRVPSQSGGWHWFRRGLSILPRRASLTQPFTTQGDSGAVIVRDGDNAVVGLLFAGNGKLSCANDMQEVFQALGCSWA